MSRSDAMIVGLKLMGACLVVIGIANAVSGTLMWFLLSQERLGDYLKYDALRDAARGGVMAAGGVVLLIFSAPWRASDIRDS